MPVGTSLGQLFDDDFHYFQNQHDPDKFPSTGELKPPETPDSNVLTPKGLEGNKNQATDPDLEIPIKNRIDVYQGEAPEKPDYDYDAWKAANPNVEMAPGQHYPDTYKLPNHMTFSNESIYHGQDGNQGGQWGTDEQGKDTFTPGPTNLQHHTMSELQDYFNRVEPNAKLLPPNIEDVPHHDWVENTIKAIRGAFALPGDVLSGKVQAGSPQEVERAADLAGLMVGGPAPVAAKMADGTLGSFMGVKSKTFNTEALQDAMSMTANKDHPDVIWNETGTFKGVDNKWRQEINDSTSAFDSKWWTNASSKLPEVLGHNDLYKAYPELRDVKVNYVPNFKGAQWDSELKTITVGSAYKENHGVLMHEIQHAIQDIEGFAKGGAPGKEHVDYKLKYEGDINKLRTPYLDLQSKEMKGTLSNIEAPMLEYLKKVFQTYSKYSAAGRDQAIENYKRLAGETESRNTDTRLFMSSRARQNVPPSSTQDTPNRQQIVSHEPAYTSPYGLIK